MYFKRGLLFLLGLISLLLGLLGVFLPLLPTVPFILLAAFCFARSSERLYLWLHSHPWFAESLKNWEEKRALRQSLKRRAMLVSAVSFGISIYLVNPLWLKGLLVVGCLCLLLYLWRLPEIADDV